MDYDSWMWGKREPFCSLSRHMFAVGACVVEYLSAPSSRGILVRLCEWMNMPAQAVIQTFAYVAALHDIGKAHPSFQKDAPDEAMGYEISNFRHEQYGARALSGRVWKKMNWNSDAVELFSAVIAMHHQGKGSCKLNDSVSRQWKARQESLEERMREQFAPARTLPRFENVDALGVLLTATLIICDWVASFNDFGAEALEDADDSRLVIRLRARAASVLKEFGLIDGDERAYPQTRGFTGLFPAIPETGVRPLQRACEALGEERAVLTIIEAPMGEGKTESALYIAGRLCAAFEKRGIYMALPTAATSNQMVGRVRAMLADHQAGKARLLHSMAWLLDDKSLPERAFNSEDAGAVSDWLRPMRRGLLSENAVGTVDQAMASVLRIKYGLLRLEGLANKVLIIDEIHAYDIFMSTIIGRLLEWCAALRIPVILLSATMQERQKRKYLACYGVSASKLSTGYPLITQVTEAGELRQTAVTGTHMQSRLHFRAVPYGSDVDGIADLALRRAERGGCVCVMMNTVRQAQALYRALKARGETQCMLFHARYTARRRDEIEKECLALFGKGGDRPRRMILVCTQVVEQSLDVDFDAMITQLAPMDLLLQRAGRVHRHQGNRRPEGMERPEIDVIVPDAGAAEDIEKRYAQIGAVYPVCVMKSTEQLLGTELEVAIPGDVRACVEAAYRDISDEALEAVIRQQMKDMLSISEAEGELLKPPEADSFFAHVPSNADMFLYDSDDDQFVRGARTREGEASQRFIFLPRDFPEQTDSMAWLREAMRYCCSIIVRKPLTERPDMLIMDNKGKQHNDKTILRESEDGLYRWQETVFSCSDEYGIEEVSD